MGMGSMGHDREVGTSTPTKYADLTWRQRQKETSVAVRTSCTAGRGGSLTASPTPPCRSLHPSPPAVHLIVLSQSTGPGADQKPFSPGCIFSSSSLLLLIVSSPLSNSSRIPFLHLSCACLVCVSVCLLRLRVACHPLPRPRHSLFAIHLHHVFPFPFSLRLLLIIIPPLRSFIYTKLDARHPAFGPRLTSHLLLTYTPPRSSSSTLGWSGSSTLSQRYHHHRRRTRLTGFAFPLPSFSALRRIAGRSCPFTQSFLCSPIPSFRSVTHLLARQKGQKSACSHPLSCRLFSPSPLLNQNPRSLGMPNSV
jgi:hypothetical protein